MRYNGIIFDLDGTLLDTLDDIDSQCSPTSETISHRSASVRFWIGGPLKWFVARSRACRSSRIPQLPLR